MRRISRIGWTCLAVIALAGCSKHEGMEAPAAAEAGSAVELAQASRGNPTPRAPAGTSLAYETDISIQMAGKDIPARVAAVQSACFSQAVGDCAVLDVKQQGGDNPFASIKVRVAPEGVEKLIGSASQGGEITSRERARKTSRKPSPTTTCVARAWKTNTSACWNSRTSRTSSSTRCCACPSAWPKWRRSSTSRSSRRRR